MREEMDEAVECLEDIIAEIKAREAGIWKQVKVNQKRRDPEKFREELRQIAAMAMRFYVEMGEHDFRK